MRMVVLNGGRYLMINPKLWKGQDLKGIWQFSIKLDGVRAIIKNGCAESKHGKPLYNLGYIPDGDYEIFTGSWESSISSVRTYEKEGVIPDHAYSLDPLDERITLCSYENPSILLINRLLKSAVDQGHEGLVLRQGNKWLKVKPFETHDVPVIGIQAGTGKHVGRMGALLTPMGKVGTGFTDKQREELKDIPLDTIIEVECMKLTPAGKFRHPRFKRIRYDKSS